jgi:1-acyl-sn-glycerol-3-phosphate acyltransferase
MNPILKIFWLIYLIFIALPLGILFTFLTAIFTLIGCTIGDHKKWGYYPGMIWSRLMCALIFSTVKVEGKENLEKGQSYVFAANHTSLYDIFIIYGFIGISFKWVMKEEIRKIPFVGAACKAAGFIFINRKAMKQALHSVEIFLFHFSLLSPIIIMGVFLFYIQKTAEKKISTVSFFCLI